MTAPDLKRPDLQDLSISTQAARSITSSTVEECSDSQSVRSSLSPGETVNDAKGDESKYYPKLDDTRAQIRLLRILPDGHIEFKVFEFGENQTYYALSYAWHELTDKDEPCHVDIQGGSEVYRKSVTYNLRAFLDHAHYFAEPGTAFWIDALCIDQQCILEKNHQVALMSEIYSKAAKVLVWLGQLTADPPWPIIYTLDRLKKHILRAHMLAARAEAKSEVKSQAKPGTNPWEDFSIAVGFGERNYWLRMWTLQEFILAKELEICMGRFCIDYNELLRIYCPDHLDCLKSVQERGVNTKYCMANAADSAIVQLCRQRNLQNHIFVPYENHDQATLASSFLSLSHTRGCSDPRDAIYALLGMHPQSGIVADYSMDGARLFWDVLTSATGTQALQMAWRIAQRFRLTLQQILSNSVNRDIWIPVSLSQPIDFDGTGPEELYKKLLKENLFSTGALSQMNTMFNSSDGSASGSWGMIMDPFGRKAIVLEDLNTRRLNKYLVIFGTTLGKRIMRVARTDIMLVFDAEGKCESWGFRTFNDPKCRLQEDTRRVAISLSELYHLCGSLEVERDFRKLENASTVLLSAFAFVFIMGVCRTGPKIQEMQPPSIHPATMSDPV